MQGETGGAIARLTELIGHPVLKLGCYLHVTDLALRFAMERALGKASSSATPGSAPSTLHNVLFHMWWVIHVGINRLEVSESFKLYAGQMHRALPELVDIPPTLHCMVYQN